MIISLPPSHTYLAGTPLARRPSRRQRHLLVPQLHEQLLQLLQDRPDLPSGTDSLRWPRRQAGDLEQLPGAGGRLNTLVRINGLTVCNTGHGASHV
jgi:hypothetical protein